MNKEQFLNKEIINKNSQRGFVMSFDEEHIVIKYEDEQKTYSTDVVFKNRFISFLDKNLNILIEEELANKEHQEMIRKHQIAKNDEIAITRNNRVNEQYDKLYMKNCLLQTLFGCDFLYPPFVKFAKKYRRLIRR